jgi:3-hydroxyisobutyrate dehydrogenase
MSQNIGFIGLGAMGLPIATNLANKGFAVLGYDINPASAARFEANGGRIAETLREVVEHSDVIITMLPAGRDVLSCAESLIAEGFSNSLLVDLSTTGVEAARALHELGDVHGIRVLDAPVSGGVMGAVKGTLAVMVGGAQADFDLAAPIFEALGSFVKHAGGPGCGQAVKICNNMAAGIIKIAISEAFALAKSMGIDESVFFEIASRGSANCFALTVTCPVPGLVESAPSTKGYSGGFATRLMLKDMKLAQSAAASSGVPLSLGSVATSLYEHCVAAGLGDYDNSIVYKFITKEDY